MIEGNLVVVAQASQSAVDRMPYGLLLARLGYESTARFRRSLRPLNLGAQQFIVLKQLQAIGSCSQGELADALGIDYSNLAGVTGELYSRGLVGRNRDAADRRRYVVALTAEGGQLLADADKAIEAGEQDMLNSLDEGEREQLWDLLRRMADALELCPSTEAEACVEAAAEQDLAD
ncbi:MAG: MarR family transcriptional regulator, lower aerobic nicotinate degradation pathway regulator [Thermoleophilaceae bacterium]|jgi:DNA-binding MarR family transcriptional regulator|nr:MarR family transcriptional regulator, lower aerobic nicotinate degradation pathway regulator [Thermoleophilaceae bacterium]